MGTHDVSNELDSERLRQFTKRLLADLRAIELMLERGDFESDRRRIGAEQELFLVDRRWCPAPLALEILEDLDDDRFTTELGRFNLEFNLDPLDWGGSCLSVMEGQLDELLAKVRAVANQHDTEVVLTGILPTLEKGDLTLDNMTPMPRYFALNEAMTRLRGREYSFFIKGADELNVTHDNVMLEACNTSFQVHFQVAPEQFAPLYNVAQVVAAPVMAAASNSPLLFGRRLWRETRIALFQQSVDTRVPTADLREMSPRVRFGQHWVDESVIEIFREDISRFRVLLGADFEEDSVAVLEAGGVPTLQALRLFNGTIYRWNRPCYGISGGKPHLRIENRVLPSGPSTRDEVANAAFWLGLMSGVSEAYPDVSRSIEFEEVRENFVAAARLGLQASLTWLDGRRVPAQTLVTEQLIPLARAGLTAGGIDSADIDLYLGLLQERVETGRTGAQWMLESWAATKEAGTRAERLATLTAASVGRQKGKEPVHTWPLASIDEAGGWQEHYLRVAQLMTTDLFTVTEDELVDLAASMMDWRNIRHVPVEDNEHRLVGLVTHREILRLLATDPSCFQGTAISVGDIMEKDVITVEPDTSTLEAIELMRQHRIGCLPVVGDGRLVAIVTERNFMSIAGYLLEGVLKGTAPAELLRWVQRGPKGEWPVQ